MNTLDSRVLAYSNCFVQKFPKRGTVRYRLTTAAGACLPVGDDGFAIEVKKKSRKQSQQHNVLVRREGNTLVPEPHKLEIEVDDVVLWRVADSRTPAFAVRGKGADMEFDSAAMRSESVFSHAFGLPGRYEWVDANGAETRGVVEVASPDARDKKACEGWLKELANGTLIHIIDGRPKPDYVKIITGQTVFWAVESAPGITITDARLVG